MIMNALEFAEHMKDKWGQAVKEADEREQLGKDQDGAIEEYTVEGLDDEGEEFTAWERGDSDGEHFTPWEDVRQLAQQTSRRSELLDEAKDLITGDRNNHYGPPHEDFQRTASILNALGFEFREEPIEAHHVAMIMATVKLSRMTWSPDKKDNWVDLAGYAACGWEARRLSNLFPEDDKEL